MKKLFAIALLASGLMMAVQANAQDDKSKRPSPPAKATAKLSSGATVTIDYSQPSINGRIIGQEGNKGVEPLDGKVWRTGANEATVFETDKDIMVADKKLPAGKYGLFTIFNGSDVTVIFSKTWKQWGAFTYKEADDALRINAKVTEATPAEGKLVFTVNPGEVGFVWGNKKVEFPVK
ncbi:MAG: DUF2911 domain-containing protein [Ferruginibacter sp.]